MIGINQSNSEQITINKSKMSEKDHIFTFNKLLINKNSWPVQI
jgi:hypothetical protein